MDRTARASRRLLLLGAAYLLFVLYGSLVPLRFDPVALQEAWSRFRAIPMLGLGIGSRADWVANILLFVPLAFLWLGALRAGRTGRLYDVAATLLVLLAAGLLSVALEFLQIFFPPRTVSQNDIAAESIGALIGVTLWWLFGHRAIHAVGRIRAVRGRSSLAEWILAPYLLFLAVYDILPLDLTLSVYNLLEKWRLGRIVVVPFGYPYPGPVEQIYSFAAEAVWWVPVAGLITLSGRLRAPAAWAVTVLAAALVEVGQLFVYSRVTDVTDTLSAASGALIGAWLGSRLREREDVGVRPRFDPTTWSLVGVGAAVLWVIVMLAAFWYPYDFTTDAETVRARLTLLRRVPFEGYYLGTEYRAIGGLVRKLSLFGVLGGLLGLSCFLRSRSGGWVCALAAGLFAAAAACAVEVGQLFLPNKIPDVTDALIGTAGSVIGFFLIRGFARRWTAGDGTDHA